MSVRDLELVEPLFWGESVQTTLFHTLDACATPMGKRLLRATLLRPAAELGEDARGGWMRWAKRWATCAGARECGGR